MDEESQRIFGGLAGCNRLLVANLIRHPQFPPSTTPLMQFDAAVVVLAASRYCSLRGQPFPPRSASSISFHDGARQNWKLPGCPSLPTSRVLPSSVNSEL